VSEGRAYPCFCTEEELAGMRERQEAEKANPGYYGKWAVWRGRSFEEIKGELDAGRPWVLRFRSEGDPEKYLHLTDLVKGQIDMPENDQDIVLLKSDGIPTYHFAHVIDDHLMRTTHVVRGDEWIATWPFHVQLFQALGWKSPNMSNRSAHEDGRRQQAQTLQAQGPGTRVGLLFCRGLSGPFRHGIPDDALEFQF
jgi:glutamyl-tRNA synthetase